MIKKIFGLLVAIVAVIAVGISAFALNASYVEITNNVGKKDSVKISGLEPKSTVSVYAENDMLLGKKTLSGSSTMANINVTLPTIEAGKIKISVIKKGGTDAETITVSHDAEPVSDAPSSVVITNNVDKKSTIVVDMLDARDLVTVYSAQEGGKKLVSGKVRNGNDEVALSYGKFTAAKSSVWISVTSPGKHEGERKEFEVPAQEQSNGFSTAEIEKYITITNNVNKKGTVEVTGLEASDVITVYADKDSTKKIGGAKCGKSKDSVKISTAKLEKEGGELWFTVKHYNELASERFAVKYDPQDVTPDLSVSANSLDATNNPAGTSDTIYIDGLEAGDIIKVYADETTTTVYLKGTVGSNKTEATLSKAQFGVDGATFYISNTRKNRLESGRVKVTVPAEVKTKKLDADYITITNNSVIASTVYVSGLNEGATITVYDKQEKGKSLGSAKVATGASSATVSVGQLGRDSGSVWVTCKNADLAESERVEAFYDAQDTSEFENYVTFDVIYNVGMASTITVRGISEGDVVKAYASETTGTTIGQATCAAYETSATISTSQLKKEGGFIYLTVTNKGKLESDPRVPYEYEGEDKSEPINDTRVTISNNVNYSPSITVWGLNSGDVITVYDTQDGSKTLGKATANSTNTYSLTFNLSSLKEIGGDLYITRKSTGLGESVRVKVSYDGQKPTTAVRKENVTIVNNANMYSTITVTGIEVSDTIKVYNSKSSTDPIAEGVSYSNEITLKTDQLSAGAGKVYITVTHYGSSESDYTEVSYSAQKVSDKVTGVTIFERTSSSVTIEILANAADEIWIYDATGKTLLGSSYVLYDGYTTITLNNLGSSAGSICISRTSYGMHESAKSSPYQYGEYK